MLTIENAKAYAAKIVGGVATYARHVKLDGMDMVQVRVRDANYRVHWMDVWVECGELYGEY